MPHLGIAVATTLGGWLNAGLLYATLVQRGHFVADARLKRALWLIVASSLVMGIGVWIAAVYLDGLFGAANVLWRAWALGVLVAAGLVVYGAAILGSGAVELRQLRSILRR